jgi:SAM-dependent methyltransferase
MAQNIYDNDEFFAGYAHLPRSIAGLDGAPEWASLRALLPPLAGARVLDLGCGYGWFCRWAREQGAERVLGIDMSEKMLQRARADTADDGAIVYARADLDTIELASGAFDLVYSSLVFHYIADLGRLFAEIHKALAANGCLVFSAEHPIYTAPSEGKWAVAADGRKSWPVDGYLVEGARSRDWLTKGVVKHHRTIATYFNTLLKVGFTVSHLDEWGPSDDQIRAQPNLAEERERPMFMLFAARRTDG